MKLFNLLILTFVFSINFATAAEITVNSGESIQEAIDSSTDGDVINISAGTYNEDLNTNGMAITLKGEDPETTIVQGSGTNSVLRITSGEGDTTIIDSLTITGGSTGRGGGIYVIDSSPTIVRNIIRDNEASSTGSGICVRGNTSDPLIINNLITGNSVSEGGGDPHSIQLTGAMARIINNTIARGDSNGIFLDGSSTGEIINNVIAFNGARIGGGLRGRGICDFGGESTIQNNLFFRNRLGALLTDRNFRKIKKAERVIGEERISNNLDRNPRFRNLRRENFDLRRKSPARDRGSELVEFNDLDGTRNDIGFTGGPEAL